MAVSQKPKNIPFVDLYIQVFPGNQDNGTVVYNPLSPPVTTRFIRLIPVGWHSRISMRIEIYGCPGTEERFHINNVFPFGLTIATTTFIMSVPETLRSSSQSRLMYLVIRSSESWKFRL